ncbi:MAG: tetratricopeptide repeat protein [Myxococcaceae bacterium]|nr:tetratricopeptide repeat protein [Myxococcaceae bacterium]MCI0670199.1 tetratricopeptide repeat protein [Myxococcaceae bacterium]
MHANVFTDARLGRLAGQFVWLSVDTEKAENAGFLERFPVEAWPSLFVIEPKEERVVLRWLGSATVEQLEALLEDGARAARGGAEGAEALLARGDRLYGEGDKKGAAAAFTEALADAPADWPRRARTVESLLMALSGADEPETCARTALAELPRLPRSPSWANVAGLGLGCALEGPKTPAWKAEAVAPLEKRVEEALAPPPIPMAPDDVSGLYEVRASARQEAGDEAGARKVAETWLAYLEAEAAKAPSPEARAVFDSHRVTAALMLGQPERVLPALQESERALPEDYNPPARQAVVLLRMGRLDEALAASDRAVARAYGPRKVRILNDRGDILLARGDRSGARTSYAEALALGQSLPKPQQPRRELRRAEAKLKELGAP